MLSQYLVLLCKLRRSLNYEYTNEFPNGYRFRDNGDVAPSIRRFLARIFGCTDGAHSNLSPKTFTGKKLIEVSSWFKHGALGAEELRLHGKFELSSLSPSIRRKFVQSFWVRLELTLQREIVERATLRVTPGNPGTGTMARFRISGDSFSRG